MTIVENYGNLARTTKKFMLVMGEHQNFPNNRTIVCSVYIFKIERFDYSKPKMKSIAVAKRQFARCRLKRLCFPAGLTLFRQFLCREFSEENLEFWLECQRFKDISEVEERAKCSRRICNLFVAFQAPR